jgi:hypothetical protein
MPVQPHAPHAPHVAHGPHAHHPVAHGPQPVARPNPAAAATASLPVDDDLVMLEEDAIALEDDGQAAPPAAAHDPAHAASAVAAHPPAPAPKKITFNADVYGKQRTWKRKHTSTGTGACRVKTFHGKCSDQGLEYLDDAINVFLDEHPDIDVKFVQSNIGMFDGKFKDFALIVNVWY